jgi:hypothetical protein
MKKMLLIPLFAIFSSSFAQVYHPIPTDSVWWVEKYQQSGLSSCLANYYNYIYPTSPSVSLGGNIYTEFRCNGQVEYTPIGPPPHFCPSNYTLTNEFYAYLRNDSVNNKVFIYDTNHTNQEQLLYNFNLSIGDTIVPYGMTNMALCTGNVITVINSDSISIGGAYRNRFELDYAGLSFPIYLIEGIGSNLGLVHTVYCPFEETTELICYHYKEFEYGNVGSNYCTQTLQVDEHIQSTETYINRTGPDHFQVTNPYTSQINLHCYDMLGKLIFSKSILQSEDLSFSEVSGGIYVMFIEYNGQKLKPNKFLISH